MAIWDTFDRIEIDRFGGLVTQTARMDLSPPESPSCEDVVFQPGAVETRPGLTELTHTTPLTASSRVVGIEGVATMGSTTGQSLFSVLLENSGYSLATPNGTNGKLWYYNDTDYFAIRDGLGIATGSAGPLRMHGIQAFGRLYMGFGDRRTGYYRPMQWSYDSTLGQRFDPITQNGPTNYPGEADGGVGTIAVATSRLWGYAYLTRNGYITPMRVNSSVGNAANVVKVISNIPKGPVDVVATLVFAGLANSTSIADMYHLPDRMTVYNDYAPGFGTLTVTFTEAELVNGLNGAEYYNRVVLPPCLGTTVYHNRLVAYGVRTVLPPNHADFYTTSGMVASSIPSRNWLAHFDEGPTPNGITIPVEPNAWVIGNAGGSAPPGPYEDLIGAELIGRGSDGNFKVGQATAVNTAGEVQAICEGTSLQTCVVLTGMAPPGAELNGIQALFPASQYFRKRQRYRYRIRCKKTANWPLTDSLYIDLTGTNYAVPPGAVNGTNCTIATINPGNIQTYWTVIEGELGEVPGGYEPEALRLRVSINDATEDDAIAIEWIDFWPADQGSISSHLYISRPYEPEVFQLTESIISFGLQDGQLVTGAFVLRNNLYVVKEHSLYVTYDNGSTEPVGWPIDIVSDDVGSVSPKGYAVTEGWAVIAARTGLYLFSGGAPEKVSQEIQPTWDDINWLYGQNLWVEIDEDERRIYVGAPFDGASPADRPNKILVLDYRDGFGAGQRRWTIWNIAADSAAFVLRPTDKRRVMLFGSNNDSGKVYRLDDGVTSDDGTAIASFYETAPLGTFNEVTLFGGLSFFASGPASIDVSKTVVNGDNQSIGQHQLDEPAYRNVEQMLNFNGERIGFRFRTNAAGSVFSLKRLAVYAKPHPYMSSRGKNP